MLGLTLLQHEQQLVEQYGQQQFDDAVGATNVYKWAAAQLLFQVGAGLHSTTCVDMHMSAWQHLLAVIWCRSALRG